MDHSQRVVNPSSSHNGVNPNAVSAALTNGNSKPSSSNKKKAYRRQDSTASGGSRSRSATKELALFFPGEDELCDSKPVLRDIVYNADEEL